MSERLNSVDIEDVLSSIRRLVSDEQRPAARAAAEPAVTPAVTPPPAAPAEMPAEMPADMPADMRSAAATEIAAEPVAAEPAPVAAAPVSKPAPVEEVAQGDKLILTPALRIAPGAEEEDSASDAAPPEAEPAAAEEPVAAFHSVRHGSGTARVEAVMDQVARGLEESDWEAPAEPPAEFASDWTMADPAPAVFEPAAMAQDRPDAGPDYGLAAPAADAGLAHGLTPVTSDVETDDAGDAWPTEDWAAPGEPDMVAPDPGGEDPGWAGIDPVSIDRMSASAQGEVPDMTPEDDGDTPPEWARMEQEALDQGLSDPRDPLADAALAGAGAAAAAAASGGAARAEQPARDARWADAAEAQIRRELEDQAEATVFARFDDDDHDDRAFDEEMLRDLVRDIIREELQGALGERITRNVRKLVRSEIARALAVRDFE
ncbi:MAG: hypothetical protein R3D90_07990 [Paracoccaceae bacterium]